MVPPVTVEQSRAIPVDLQRAFEATLSIPLTSVFSRRYGLLPTVREVRGPNGEWGKAGQSRTVLTSDGGTMREVLTDVDAPRSFSYRLSDVTGPLRPLVASIEGRWEFAPIGTGTLITWRWTLQPTRAGSLLVALIARMWPGYARQALEVLSEQLLASVPSEPSPARTL